MRDAFCLHICPTVFCSGVFSHILNGATLHHLGFLMRYKHTHVVKVNASLPAKGCSEVVWASPLLQ